MSTKTNLIVDMVIFAAFLVVSNPHLTGNTIHEWLGVAFGAAIVTHLLFHWHWLVINIRRYIASPVASIFKPREQKPVIAMTLQTSKEK